ncbi:T9SS type A sorting domain-containing protein [Marinilabilia salmonicolor]|uniref:T9SS type A sorting domain-containing protein n=1 Tax=Marinilabilia salmonicolor TaxID=989 RepID=UPI00029A05E0|nr:T9SS type A sorting domain-containing protein [Marinilabilia salmonicolor]
MKLIYPICLFKIAKPVLVGFILVLFTNSSFGQETMFFDDFETDQGWTLTGEFERGAPAGGSGSHGNPNPTDAYSGTNVIGTDLDGAYSDYLGDRAYIAESPTIDCSGYANITLNFQRWLNLEQSYYDHGYIDYYDGTTWINIWENPNTTLQESSWSLQSIQLPVSANDNPNVKLRFAIGSTDSGWNYSGWNIDDVEITGSKIPGGNGVNLVYWLRGDLGVSGSNPISEWADQSGNGNDATPDPDGPNQVVSIEMNNQEVLSFDGSQELNITDDGRINSGNGYNGDERTMALAFKTGSDVSGTQYLYEQGGGTNGIGVFIKNNNVYVTIYNNNGAERLTVYESVTANTKYVLSFNWNKGDLSAKLNNSLFSNQSSNGSISSINAHSGDISIGFTDGGTRDENGGNQSGGANFRGEIAEIIYYDQSLLPAEEIAINDDLATRYGISHTPSTHYYSYKSGDWDVVDTWTHDPGGTTQTATDIPGENDKVTILDGRVVRLEGDVSTSRLDATINDGGILDQSEFQFVNGFEALRGTGTFRLASDNFPSVLINDFVQSGGGTTEYYNSSDFELPAQSVYNNLIINTTGNRASLLNDITINGDFQVESGTFRIGNNSVTNPLSLTVNGNVTVDNGASIITGTGKTNTTNNPNGITGGTAPFLDYYTHFHTVILKGDFTNNGTVRFTNLDYPVFNSFPSASGKTGAATVYFQGAGNNKLTCNGTTDFYNLVLDKGLDQTYKLTVYSSAYENFRLFGANSSGGDTNGATEENPNLKKALWIRTGTLELTGLTVIPSLTEGGGGGTPNSDYYIPVNGALLLNGPEVILLNTADNYAEVNAAYGVSGGTGEVNGVNKGSNASSFSIYGRFQVDDGYFSTRESGGLITWDKASGQLDINGGYIDAKQFRAAGGASGLASYMQTGGTLALRGRYQRTPSQYNSPADLRAVSQATINTNTSTSGLEGSKGTFNINAEANVFAMSGGEVEIYDVCGGNNYAVDIFSADNNINVTGGTFKFLSLNGNNDFKIRSQAPFGNIVVDRSNAGALLTLNDDYALTVIKNIDLTRGGLRANNLDVTVGGDFNIAANGTYHSGTNTTLFNGKVDQLFSVSGTVNNGNDGLADLTVSKDGGVLSLDGDMTGLTVQGAFTLTKGIFDDGGKTLFVKGNVTNSGTHTGDGSIQLNGSSVQTIGGDGNGAFGNLTLNNNNGAAAPVSLTADISVDGTLTFSSAKHINIDTQNLRLGADAAISGAGNDRFIQTAGNAGDGGLTIAYNSTASRVFPVGVEGYTPAAMGFSSAPGSYGSITVVPVNYAHPVVTAENVSLDYFWRVKSEGFTGYEGKVTHSFVYNQSDVSGTESNYIPAVYDAGNYTWNYGTASSVNSGNNTISDWTSPGLSTDFIDGDYTAGVVTAFGEPSKFYSRRSGNWNQTNTWSTTGHSGNAASRIPAEGDVVIIGTGHTVSLERSTNRNGYPNRNTKNEDVQNCATLQIETGGVLDVKYSPASNFGIVMSHPNGNGLLRVSTAYSSGSTFELPKGDFTDFNKNLGTTELYTINNTAGTTYWLPNDIESYGNLVVTPMGGSNIIFGNTDVTIYGDLTTQGLTSEGWYAPTWNSNYPTSPAGKKAKTISIKGNFNLEGGALIFYDNGNLAQNFIIEGDLVVSEGAGIQVYSNANNQSFKIGGDLVNNASFGNGANAYAGCDFSGIPVTFFGDSDAKITNTSGAPDTQFEEVTVNKGSSQSTKLTIDIAGDLNTPDNNWLTLENGTLEYKRVNPNSDFTISTSTPFTIPSTAGLYVDYDNSNNRRVLIGDDNSDNNDLFLNGKLTIVKGEVYVGDPNSRNNNNDIEYAGGGASTIDVRGGKLVVNGQIRRNPATTSGILSYLQSGGEVTINGRKTLTTNAKLEVLNAGSRFNMSGGTLKILRGGGGNSYGDLYLRPETSNVTGGEIVFVASTGDQTYLVDANVPLNNLTVTGAAGSDAMVKMMVSALTLQGDMTLSNTYSVFDANSEFDIDLIIKGNMVNNGTYNHYNNLTTFSGGEQSIEGNTATDFYDLKINPVTSVTLSRDVNVFNDMELASGRLITGANLVSIEGDLINNANYESDDDAGGVLLINGDTRHLLSGTGTFGRLELNDSKGARLENDITLENNLILSNGIFDINDNLLTLGVNSDIQGSDFNNFKMITSDGVYSNIGIKKYLPVIGSPETFTFPMGLAGKYTPAVLNITQNSQVGSVRVNTINEKHPSAKSPFRVLDYYWEVESAGLSGFSGSFDMVYHDDDILQAAADENNYVAARLLVPGTSWSKATPGAATDKVDESNNTISFTFGGANTVSGEYTAGFVSEIPDKVPSYEANVSGNWSDKNIWTPVGDAPACPEGGPNGAVVIINAAVTADADNCFAYRTIINDQLKIVSPYIGHNLGSIEGEGTLYVESPVMPAGRYTDFLDCGRNSTLEFGGSGNYNIVADLFTSIPNLKISGTGTRVLPNENLTVCNSLVIDGATLDNSVNNKTLIIGGTMERYNGGRFVAGAGSEATVRFAGNSAQNIGGATGDFNGINAFNNLEIDNNSGLTINGATEISGILQLTSGVINTSDANPLTITNSLGTSVSPVGGRADSYINGPLIKRINQGDSFRFPVGKDGALGNKLTLVATQSGITDWKVEYFTPNTTYANYNNPVTYVNSKEYWKVSAPSGSKARISINWDASSDVTPLITVGGVDDLLVVGYDALASEWTEISSSASGSNNNGTIITDSRVTVPAAGEMDFTSATLNTVKPKAKLTPDGAICGTSAGIPVTFTSSFPVPFNYVLNYTIDGVAQSAVTVTSIPYVLSTPQSGVYQLTGYTYDNGNGTGVVDEGEVTVYATPTDADAGEDQSLCGASATVLEGNNPLVGEGLWTIVSGTGGTIDQPTVATSDFSGTNGSSYTLLWTISNGECTSSDEVTITFPVLADQPGEFTEYDTEVCQGVNNVVFTVPLDVTISNYNWSYSGEDVIINGTGNSVSLSFGISATSGTLSVTAENNCGESDPREIGITVNEAISGVTLESNIEGSLCVNNSPVFTAIPAETITGLSYEFFVNGVSGQNGASETFEPVNLMDADVVNVVATSADGCSTTSNDIAVSVVATDGLWMGSADADWNNPVNWCANVVPSTGDITISGNSVHAPEITSDMNLTWLTIEENANLVVKPGVMLEVTGDVVNDGKITLESDADALAALYLPELPTKAGIGNVVMNMPKNYYWYIGSPLRSEVDGKAKASWFGDLNNDPNSIDWVFVLRYKNGRNQWLRVVGDIDLNEMEGVSTWYYQNKVLDYEGEINVGELSRTFAEIDHHLFANPYPTAIDWEDPSGWGRSDFGNTMWNRVTFGGERTWQTYNNGGDDDPGVYALPPEAFGQTEENVSYIPPYQTVWIKAEKENSTLTVSPETRVKDNSVGLKSAGSGGSQEVNIIRLKISNSKALDGTVIYFSDNFMDEKGREDSEKRFNDSKNIPEIYTRIGGNAFSINGKFLLTEPAYSLPVSVRTRIIEETKISVNLSRFEANYDVFLEDKETGAWVNMKEYPEYVFMPIHQGHEHNRFVLHLEKTQEIPTNLNDSDEFNTGDISIIGRSEYALVKISSDLLQSSGALIEVLDMNGRLMDRITTNETESEIDLPDNSGVYVVRVKTGGTIKTEKVVR